MLLQLGQRQGEKREREREREVLERTKQSIMVRHFLGRIEETLCHTLKGSIPWMAPEAHSTILSRFEVYNLHYELPTLDLKSQCFRID